jgi:hypothetical protein
MAERRKGARTVVPQIYREYITFKIKEKSGEFVDAELLDFGPYGIRAKNRLAFPVDSAIECLISIPKSLTKEIPFTAKIKYSLPNEPEGDYLIGAEILQTGDPLWLNVFSRVHDFIKERMGEIF